MRIKSWPFLLFCIVSILGIIYYANRKYPSTVSQLIAYLPHTCSEQNTLDSVKKCTVLVKRDDGGHGTGFSVQKGYIVTAKHVIEGAKKITIWFNGEKTVDLWNYSTKDDIAVLKTNEDIPICKWGNSDKLKLAETVYAIGWPEIPEGESSVTKGIFSRFMTSPDGPPLIQTDAAINPGNSGGPLLNECGIVGLNAFKYTWSDPQTPAEGFGFAISSNYIKNQLEALIANGKTINSSDNLALLLNKVSKLIELPDEEVTLATVSDITKLKGQPFFNNAQNGDRVLIYLKSKKAILYRPSTNKIIDVGPVQL